MEEDIVRKPAYQLRYQGREISRDLSPILLGFTFEDALEDNAGTLSFSLINQDLRWLGGWLPQVEDQIELSMGYEEGPLRSCGTFFIDEIRASGSRSGDLFEFKALSQKPAAKYAPTLTVIYEGTFADFAQKIAQPLGMSLQGDLSGTVRATSTANGLGLLADQAARLGKIMKTEGQAIVFYNRAQIRNQAQRLALRREDVKSYSLADKAQGRFTTCECRHWDAATKSLIQGSHSLGVAGGGKATIRQAVKTTAEAAEAAKTWLEDRNKKGVEIAIDLMGDARLTSGVAIQLQGFGAYSGPCYIAASKHAWSRGGGYVTSLTLRR